jgi:recombination protein RecA
MDGDGRVVKVKSTSCSSYYTTTSSNLSRDVIRLVTSLGGITTLTERVKGYTFAVRVSTPFNPFKLSEHRNTWRVTTKNKRSVSKIVPNGKLPIRCIMVEAPDHLYIADTHYHIVTHNTTQALHIIKSAQDSGLTCSLSDIEGTTDEEYLLNFGIDVSRLIYTRPDGTEEATQAILDMQRSGLVQLSVIDSIASMKPTKVLDSEMDDSVQMAIQPKLLDEFFGKWTACNNKLVREGKESFTILGLNQLRDKIGGYGDPSYTPGGRSKDFYSSVNIRYRRGDWITEGTGVDKEIVGQVVKYLIPKNKTYKRMQTGEFDFYFAENEKGITPGFNDTAKEIIMCAMDYGVVIKSGGWYYINEDEKYQGKDACIEAVRSDPLLIESLKERVLEVAFNPLLV